MQRQNAITKHQKARSNQWDIYFLLLLQDMLISVNVHFLKFIIDLDTDKIHQQNSASILRHLKVNVLFFNRFLKPILSFNTLHINLIIFHMQICILSVIHEQKNHFEL